MEQRTILNIRFVQEHYLEIESHAKGGQIPIIAGYDRVQEFVAIATVNLAGTIKHMLLNWPIDRPTALETAKVLGGSDSPIKFFDFSSAASSQSSEE